MNRTANFQVIRTPKDFVPFDEANIEQSVSARFEEQVKRHPQKPALKTGGHTFSYEALNQAANRVANAVLSRYKKDAPIALYLKRTERIIVSILGVLKAGKIYIPIDPEHPLERNAKIMEDSLAGLIITDTDNYANLKKIKHCPDLILNVDEMDRLQSSSDPVFSVSPDAIAYIIYTSGSIGRPKGVAHNHRNVLHYTMKYANALKISPLDRVSLLSSCSFASAAADMFNSLLNGACLFPFQVKEEGLNGLAQWLMQEKITIYHSIPSLFRHVTSVLTGEESFPMLRVVRLSGEPVTRRDTDLFKTYFSQTCTLVNSFSATEFHGIRIFCIDHNTQLPTNNVPVGFAMDDADVSLRDAAGNELPMGQVGEIVIKSPYLALGYWRNARITKDNFVPDQMGTGTRIYRTGDLGYMLSNECLVHLGRKDNQVKIRGYRIELGEIETVMEQHPQVKRAVVIAREDEPGEKRIVAYPVPHDSEKLSVTDLRNYLKEQLPGHMVPSAFMVLDALPLMVNGKVDYKALPAPDTVRPDLESVYVAPRNDVEKKIIQIWQDMLMLEKVGIHDNFFDLGGHSLLAIRVISRIRSDLGVNLSILDFFAAPSPAQMAEVITQQQTIDPTNDEDAELLAEISQLTKEEVRWELMNNEVQPETEGHHEDS